MSKELEGLFGLTKMECDRGRAWGEWGLREGVRKSLETNGVKNREEEKRGKGDGGWCFKQGCFNRGEGVGVYVTFYYIGGFK